MAKKKPDKQEVKEAEKEDPQKIVDDQDYVLRGLPDRDVYRPSEVALYLALSERTIDRYAEEGYLKKVKKGRGVVWVTRESLIGFVRCTLGVRLGLSERIKSYLQG